MSEQHLDDQGLRTASHRCGPVTSAWTACWTPLAGLDDLPVAEHVAVFERAHEELRAALDARPDA